MYRNEHPTLPLPRRAAPRRTGWTLGALRREWVGRDVELVPAGQGPEAWLLVDVNGERGWLPVGLRTLGELTRAVGGDYGRVRGGTAVAFNQPLPLSVLQAYEPHTYSLLEQAVTAIDMGEDPHLGSFFSSIGSSISHAIDKVKSAVKSAVSRAVSVAKKAASTASKAASSVGKAVSSAAKKTGEVVKDIGTEIKEHGKTVMAGAMIAGGVAVGIASGGTLLPVAGALVGAGIGVATKPGENLGKFSEWAPRAAIGGGIGAAAGFGAQWVMNGGLSQVGSTLFSSSTGETIGTVGAATPATTAATSGSSLWSSLPVGGILKTAAGFIFKGSAGPMPLMPAPGMAPTDPGMTAMPPVTQQYAGYEQPAAAPSGELIPGVSNTVLAIGGIALLGVLVLGLRR